MEIRTNKFTLIIYGDIHTIQISVSMIRRYKHIIYGKRISMCEWKNVHRINCTLFKLQRRSRCTYSKKREIFFKDSSPIENFFTLHTFQYIQIEYLILTVTFCRRRGGGEGDRTLHPRAVPPRVFSPMDNFHLENSTPVTSPHGPFLP